MTKVSKISNSQRLSVLNNRYEKLIALNAKHHYTQSGNPKCKKYLNLLKRIYEEKAGLYIFNRKNSKVFMGNLESAKKAVISLTREHLFNLTNQAV